MFGRFFMLMIVAVVSTEPIRREGKSKLHATVLSGSLNYF
jgi:hypothetical protein